MYASFLNNLPETSVLRKVLRENPEEQPLRPRIFLEFLNKIAISLEKYESPFMARGNYAGDTFSWILADTIQGNLKETAVFPSESEEKLAKKSEDPPNFQANTGNNEEIVNEINGFSFQSEEKVQEKPGKSPQRLDNPEIAKKSPIIIDDDEEKPSFSKENGGFDEVPPQKSANFSDNPGKSEKLATFPRKSQRPSESQDKNSLLSGIELRMRENVQEIRELKRKLKEDSLKALKNSENFIDLDEFEKKQEIFAEIDEFNEEILQNKEIYKRNGFFSEKPELFVEKLPENGEKKLQCCEKVEKNAEKPQENRVFSPIIQAILEENEAITLKSTINAVKTQQKQLNFKRKCSETAELVEKDVESAVFVENSRKKTLKTSCFRENFCVNCFENTHNFKANYFRLCERCFGDLPAISQSFQIKIRDEPDKFEYFERKQKIGERFQAKIPEIQRKSEFSPDFPAFSLSNPALIKVNSPKPQELREKSESFEIFAAKAKESLEIEVSVEKLAYLLTLFDYNYDECLKQIANNRQAFALFLDYFKC